MKLQVFKDALQGAGWGSISDDKYYGIEDLHNKLFPLVAELEKENFELYCLIPENENLSCSGHLNKNQVNELQEELQANDALTAGDRLLRFNGEMAIPKYSDSSWNAE